MRRMLVILPLALLLAACGGSSDESDESASGDVLQTIRISETEFSLNPNTVTLSQPGTYEFEVTNDGQITHALEIEESGDGAEAETGDIGAGESKTLRFTFSGEGSYEMYCPIGNHKDEGMRGTIVVGNAAGGGGTTTDEEDETTTDETTTDDSPGY
jgi:PQQ system protein